MRNYQRESECVALIGSMTQALRAQRLLASAAIRSDVIKADGVRGRRGCAYALSYPCYQNNNVIQLLRAEGIRAQYTTLEGGDG